MATADEFAQLALLFTDPIAGVQPLVDQDAQESQEGQSQLFWLHDTTVMGWQQHDEPIRVRY